MPADLAPVRHQKPPRARVFFALWPSVENADRLAAIAADAVAGFGGYAMRRDTIHMTLAFVGEIPEYRLDDLRRVGTEVGGEAFDMALDRMEHWAHNRLLWAGCAGTPPALAKLVEALRRRLKATGFPVDGGRQDFTPHVTLVRKLPAESGQAFAEPHALNPAIPWHNDRFVLVRSRLSDAGPAYGIIDSFPLRSPDTA